MDRKISIPIFPDPPREGYTFTWGSGLIRALDQMAQILRNPGEARATTMVITNLPTSDYGLEPGSLFRQGNQVFITLTDRPVPGALTGTTRLGTVTVTTV